MKCNIDEKHSNNDNLLFQQQNPFMMTTNQSYGLNLESLKHVTFSSHVKSPIENNNLSKETKGRQSQKYDLSFLYSQESDKYGIGIPPSDSYLAQALSKKVSLSTVAKLKRLSCTGEEDPLTASSSKKLSRDQIKQYLDNYSHKSKREHILFSTTANQIGYKRPSLATMQASRHPRSQTFSTSFNKTMFHDHGLNTALSKSKFHKSLDPVFI